MLDILNLKIEPGENFCLSSANGAGGTDGKFVSEFCRIDERKALKKNFDAMRKRLETKKYLACILGQINLYKHPNSNKLNHHLME